MRHEEIEVDRSLYAAAFLGVAFLAAALGAAFFFGAAFLSATLVLVTRPVLVFLRTVGVSTTAGACSRLVSEVAMVVEPGTHTSAGAFGAVVFFALGFAVFALVLVAVFFGAAFFAVGTFVLVEAFLGAAFFAVVVFGLASFLYVLVRCGPLWYWYANLGCSSLGCSGRLSLLLRKLHRSRCAYSAMCQ
jgi:hypothetical protein